MADLLDAAEDDAGAEVPAAAGSEAFKPHGGQQHRVEGRGDGRRASRVSTPAYARGRRGGLDGEEDRTFFVVRKRPEGAAVKYWLISRYAATRVGASHPQAPRHEDTYLGYLDADAHPHAAWCSS